MESKLLCDSYKGVNAIHEGFLFISSPDPNYFPKSSANTWVEGIECQYGI